MSSLLEILETNSMLVIHDDGHVSNLLEILETNSMLVIHDDGCLAMILLVPICLPTRFVCLLCPIDLPSTLARAAFLLLALPDAYRFPLHPSQ